MARQWIRAVHLTAEGGGGKIDLSTLRIRFTIQEHAIQSPATLNAIVTNVSKSTMRRFEAKEFTKVTLSAGYGENESVIFKGSIIYANSGRETPTETYLRLQCLDGDAAYNFGVVNKTLGAGATGKDQYDALLEAMKPFGIEKGHVTDAVAKLKFPRPLVMYGQVKDFLRTLAHSTDATWAIRQGKLDMVGKLETKPGDTVVLNAATGMIGMPERGQQGIVVRALLNPQIAVCRKIKLDNASINTAAFDATLLGQIKSSLVPDLDSDGLYKVLKLETEGDTRGNAFYMTMWCVALSGGGWTPTNLIPYLGKS